MIENPLGASIKKYVDSSSKGSKVTVTQTLKSGKEVGKISVDGVSTTLYCDQNTDSDTKNTAGSTDTSSKLFLIGATSQAANPVTYSQDTAYVGTDGKLYSGGKQTLTVDDVSTAGKTGSYTDLTNKPTIPSVGNATLTIQKNGTAVATFSANATANATANITVPTKVSELSNDSAFITKAVSDLTNYYTKSNTYSKTEVNALLTDRLKIEIVDALPTSGISSTTIYLVPNTSTSTQALPDGGIASVVNSYDEYVYVNGTWEKIGTTVADLSQYSLKADTVKSLSISGKTITVTKGDGTTSTLTTQDTNTDTKNTAGSTQSASKLFLVGATSQAANPQTYSNAKAYVGTDSCLYSDGAKVLTAHPGVTKTADTTSSESPAHGKSFTAISSVTRDSFGHVTSVNTKTITLPADNNTDTMVNQFKSTADEERPVLIKVNTGDTSMTGAVDFSSGVTINPNAGRITATSFEGLASKATGDKNGVDITGYVKGLSISGRTITVTKGDNTTTTLTTQDTDTNTDTKTSQTNSTANTAYPILLKNGTGTGAVTNGVLFNSGVTVNPSTGTVVAKTFSGKATSAGTADSATKATNDSSGNAITSYVKGISISGRTITVTKGDNTTSTLTTQDTNTTYVAATQSANGLMSSTDKKKLDGIASGAQANVIESVKVNGTALTPSSKAVNIDLSGYAKKTDITAVLKYKGAKDAVADLPSTGNTTGDVWHVNANNGEYAWDGTEWQELGSSVDLSAYSTKSETVKSLSISGRTITVTPAQGNAYTLTTQDTNTDTKNTAGTTQSTAKLFIAGATSQAANPVTYSNSKVYIGTDSCLYSNNAKVLTAHPAVTKSTDTTSTASPAHGATFTAVDSVTRDSFGHVTAVNTKTVTLPADNNTDTKTSQTHSTANGAYPILLKNGTGTGTVTNGALFDGDVTVNPSNGKITAKAFVGALEGNASTATKATQDGGGKVIADTYATKTVATASADGLMSKTDKANMVYVHRYAVVGQNSNTATKRWFKVAELKGKTNSYWDPFISFYVWEGYTTTSHGGILTVHFRTGSNGAVEGKEFYWQLASSNCLYDRFVIAYDPNATSTTYELWYQSDSWDIKKFEVIAEGDRNNSYALWTLFQNVANDGDATAPTSGYTQLTSAILDIRNRSTLSAYADSAGKATNDDAGRHIPSYYWRIDDTLLDAYTMTKTDWNGNVPIRKRVNSFKTAAESPDGQNTGDYYLYNLGHVDSAGYATILAVSPRINDRLFTGHFWNGVWQGWKEISLSRDTVKSLSISGKTITVTKGDGTTSTLTTQDTVPTVGNATLTIQKNGTSVGTFTANATANKSINIAVPTKVSELTNDSGFKTTDTNTVNTAGTTNKTGTKMFLVGAPSQAASPVTYSNSNCYVGTDNCLYSGGKKVLTSYTDTNDEVRQNDISDVGYEGYASLLMNGGTTSGATGEALYSSDVFYNTTSQTLHAPNFEGTISNADYATSAGSATKATQDGNGNVISSTYLKSIPTASSSTLGGIKVGSGLSISNGVLSNGINSDSTLTVKQLIATDYVMGMTRVHVKDTQKSYTDTDSDYFPNTHIDFLDKDNEPIARMYPRISTDVNQWWLQVRTKSGQDNSLCMSSDGSAYVNGQIVITSGKIGAGIKFDATGIQAMFLAGIRSASGSNSNGFPEGASYKIVNVGNDGRIVFGCVDCPGNGVQTVNLPIAFAGVPIVYVTGMRNDNSDYPLQVSNITRVSFKYRSSSGYDSIAYIAVGV